MAIAAGSAAVRTILQGAADLRQHLIGQLQQDLPCGVKQRLTFTHKQTEAEALFQIAELVRQGGLGLVQAAAPASAAIPQRLSVFRCLISIMKVLHFGMNNLRLRNIQ
jgi:hypothetical protein